VGLLRDGAANFLQLVVLELRVVVPAGVTSGVMGCVFAAELSLDRLEGDSEDALVQPSADIGRLWLPGLAAVGFGAELFRGEVTNWRV